MTARKHCLTCNRGAKFVEGCSHVECPQRRMVTAQPPGTPYWSPSDMPYFLGCPAREGMSVSLMLPKELVSQSAPWDLLTDEDKQRRVPKGDA